ncbi:MAG: aldo/keto reductase [Pseudomonadota bacterium]
MNFREPVILGRSGLKVSRLGIGAGYGVPAGAIEKAYHEYGINYLYWLSRKQGMKEAIRRLARADRDKIVITIQSSDHTGFYTVRSIEKGLKALGIDHADVFQFGWFNKIPKQRVMDAAMKLREQGKVRFFGMSGHNRKTFGKLAQMTDSPIDIFQCRYNAAHRGAEKEIFPFLPEKDRPGVTTYTATRWGNLLQQKKMPPGEKPLTAAECYRFVLTNPSVDLCMTGPADDRQMDEALEALDAGPLSEDEMERVRRIGDHVHEKSKWLW